MQWYDIWLLLFAVLLTLNTLIIIRTGKPVLAVVVSIIDLVTIYAITQTVTW